MDRNSHRLCREKEEVVGPVEGRDALVLGIDHDRVGGNLASARVGEGVHQLVLAESMATVPAIDGEVAVAGTSG
jgi:hypothetical protein